MLQETEQEVADLLTDSEKEVSELGLGTWYDL